MSKTAHAPSVAVVGDAVVGDAVVGDAVVGDAVVGDAVGDALQRHCLSLEHEASIAVD